MISFTVAQQRLSRRRNPNLVSSSGPLHLMEKKKPPKRHFPVKPSSKHRKPTATPSGIQDPLPALASPGGINEVSVIESRDRGEITLTNAQSTVTTTDLAISLKPDLPDVSDIAAPEVTEPVKVVQATEPTSNVIPTKETRKGSNPTSETVVKETA